MPLWPHHAPRGRRSLRGYRSDENFEAKPPMAGQMRAFSAESRMRDSVALTLIGTVHGDPLGPGALSILLENISPAAITVEISRFSVEYRRNHHEEWLRLLPLVSSQLPGDRRGHAHLQLLKRQLLMPFEWVISCAYAASRGIPCLAIDTGAVAKEELPTWRHEVLSEKNLQTLTSEPDFDLHDRFSTLYVRAERVLRSPGAWVEAVHPLAWLKEETSEKREHMLARRIRLLLSVASNVVHVGGWEHLVLGTPWPTMASVLRDLDPRRVLLRKGHMK